MDPVERGRDMGRRNVGIPKKCPCGGRIIDEVGGKDDEDNLPGSRFFTCSNYKADGLHYRQPWVLGVQDEIGIIGERLRDARERVGQDVQMISLTRSMCDTLEKQLTELYDTVTELEEMFGGSGQP